jgi:hypothetical protein
MGVKNYSKTVHARETESGWLQWNPNREFYFRPVTLFQRPLHCLASTFVSYPSGALTFSKQAASSVAGTAVLATLFTIAALHRATATEVRDPGPPPAGGGRSPLPAGRQTAARSAALRAAAAATPAAGPGGRPSPGARTPPSWSTSAHTPHAASGSVCFAISGGATTAGMEPTPGVAAAKPQQWLVNISLLRGLEASDWIWGSFANWSWDAASGLCYRYVKVLDEYSVYPMPRCYECWL